MYAETDLISTNKRALSTITGHRRPAYGYDMITWCEACGAAIEPVAIPVAGNEPVKPVSVITTLLL